MTMKTAAGAKLCRIGSAAMLLTLASGGLSAQATFNKNLIVNGDAESGPASSNGTAVVPNIPGWTATGNANVVPYDLVGYLQSTDQAPPDRQFQYFSGAPSGGTSTITQTIDVSALSTAINAGTVKFSLSGYEGTLPNSYDPPAQLSAAFQNSKAQTFTTATLSLSRCGIETGGAGLCLHTAVQISRARA